MKTIALGIVVSGLLLADFRYDQTTRITKGMVTKMAFGKKPEPTTTSHYFKGSRMAMVSKDSKTIIDFDKQNFTTVNLAKQQYWQMTFEEMRQMMADLQADMKDATKGKDVSMNMKFDAKATGVEKEVGGFNAKQVIFTIETGASDGKQSGTMMKMVNDSWHSEAVPGYGEYKAFYERLKDKASWLGMGGNPMAQMGGQPGMVEGMKKMAEEMQKTPGIAVLTISRMTMPGMNLSGGGGGGNSDQSVKPTMGDLVGGALGGRLGGFGRRKKEEPAPVKQAPEPSVESNSGEGMLMMESFSDSSGFSTASIGEDVFAIPAGFAKVEPEMAKRRKR
ncbi:MAG: hypothetical protein NTW74_17020 [Acidobacteria bacterium]|nr:hypothetical protein [Acidobacteriota bacterium]